MLMNSNSPDNFRKHVLEYHWSLKFVILYKIGEPNLLQYACLRHNVYLFIHRTSYVDVYILCPITTQMHFHRFNKRDPFIHAIWLQ